MTAISFSICSIIYIIIFSVVYFSRNRINLIENKIYSLLLITTLIGLSIDITGYFAFKDMNTTSLKNLTIAKIYLIYNFTWCYLMTLYTYIISNKKKKKLKIKPFKLIYIIIFLITLILPIKINNENNNIYSYGLSVNFVYLISFICILLMLIMIIKNIKNIRKKEYIPLLVLIIFGAVIVLIQKYNPDLLLIITGQSIVTSLMYFTIENPDIRMIEELNKNKKLTEKNFEEKINFLFKISQELKKPLQDIKNLSNEIYNSENETTTKINSKKISENANQLYQYVNKALDISQMDVKNIKTITETYNIYSLLEEIKLRINNELKKENKDIQFRYNISSNIPKILYGDKTKLKQILISLINNCIKHTKKGFIELNIDSIIKYDVCRLLIEVIDSGKGMELDKINEILNSNENLTEKEIKDLQTMDIDINTTYKIIKVLNGNLIIRSDINTGTTFIIILEQKIKKQEKTETLQKMEQYSSNILDLNKILFISINEKLKEKIEQKLNETELIMSYYSDDSITKLKTYKKYKCILIDEKIGNESGIDILKKIKEIINIPVIMLIEEKNEFLRKHYLKEGFNECIIKEKIDKEIKKISKYL